jgi:hypothetical protein
MNNNEMATNKHGKTTHIKCVPYQWSFKEMCNSEGGLMYQNRQQYKIYEHAKYFDRNTNIEYMNYKL